MDLNAPLGSRPPSPPKRNVPLIVGASCAAAILSALGVFLATADPRDGEPFGTAAIPPALPKPAVSQQAEAHATVDPSPTGSIAASNRPPVEAGVVENGVTVYRGAPSLTQTGGAGSPQIIDVTKVLDAPTRTAKDGGTGTTVTSGTPASPGGAMTPRIAIFVSGMGLSQAATRAAIDTMPAAVDLAFVPYGATIAAFVDAAKARNHEILLQLPMASGTGAGPGPHALKPGAPAAATADDLAWLMGRFGGYTGVTNLLGGAVTADSATMTAVLKAVGRRGLFYVDDGTSTRSVATALAPDLGTPALAADVVLDATADPTVVKANLDRLVDIARRNGSAIGMASGLPDHLPAIAHFAADLPSQGLALVPVSALVARGASVATAP